MSDETSGTPGDQSPSAAGPGEPDVVPIVGDSSGPIGADTDAGPMSLTPSEVGPPTAPPPFVPADIPDNQRDPGPFGSPPSGDALPVGPESADVPPDVSEPTVDPPATDGEVVPITGDSGEPTVDPPATDGEVVPITGDSGEGSDGPAAGTSASSMVADVFEEVVDEEGLHDGDGSASGVVDALASWIRSSPSHLALAVGLVAVVLVVVLVLTLGGSSGHTHTAQAGAPSSTTTTAAPHAAPLGVSLVLGLGLETGAPPDNLPLHFTVQVAAAAPGDQTVNLAYTGPGLPGGDTMSVAPGGSVTHTFMVGCGSWTVRITSIDGRPIVAEDNPALENGATHLCPTP